MCLSEFEGFRSIVRRSPPNGLSTAETGLVEGGLRNETSLPLNPLSMPNNIRPGDLGSFVTVRCLSGDSGT